ncbi:MAG: zinc ribbon domain-containing protein YjdM [Chitinophagales bacterium]|jgi:protein PhnA|nr:zinc ribbon domain-containing protein YjdM [Chitinophagales bacterium]
MSELICLKCQSPHVYEVEGVFTCPECAYEWTNEDLIADSLVVKDANGNILQDGDTVIVIKNLPVKGSAHPIKSGTKVKNIRLVDSDHNIDCKIEGFGSMALKSEFVKKA